MKYLASILLACILLVGLATATPANFTIHSSANVLYLPMNGSVGCSTFFDYTPYKHAMASYGTTLTPAMNATNVFGGASGYFPGPAYVAYIRPGSPSADYNASAATDVSWSFWMKAPSQPTNTRIYYAGTVGTNFEIEIVNHHLAIYTNPLGVHTELSAVTIDDDVWHYIVVKRPPASGVVTGYVDGVAGATTPAVADIIGSTTESPYIGSHNAGGSAYRGLLDDFNMYNGYIIDGTVVPSREYISNPTSGFSANASSGVAPLVVGFGNRTFGNAATMYLWNITTDVNTTPYTIASGATANAPNYTFSDPGNYLVNLTVTNAFGSSSSYSWINVTGSTAGLATFTMTNVTPVLSASASALSGYSPTTVSFTNTSAGFNGTPTFSWTYTPISTGIPVVFSTSASPQYTFSNSGNYSIALTVSNPYFTNTSTQTAWVNLTPQPQIVADFVANTTSQIIPSGAVLFTDKSSGFTPNTWLWNFGDGSASTSENPTHTYTSAGLYTVSLTASRSDNTSNTDTETKVDYINITYSPFYINPDFVGTPTDGSPGLLVSFTDLTVVGNTTASKTCNWSFGDSISTTPYSSSCGNVQHVYTYAGVYDVNLSVTMFGNTSYENKQMYITISTDQGPQLQVYPKFTTFHIKSDVFGTPLEGVNVSVSPISTSMGAWDWVGTLLGIPIGEVNLDNTSLYQTSDSYGRATFFIVNTQKYNVTFTKTGYTINPLIVVPQDDNYIVTAISTESQFYREGVDELTTVNISVTTTLYNSTHAFINLTYNDSSLHTTGGYVEVLQKNDKPWTSPTQMAYWPVTGNSFSNSTTIVHIQQVSGYVNANISHSDFGYITRSYPYSFNSIPVEFLGFSRDITLIVALGIMLFTMMLGGAAHARILVVIVATEGWIFYTMHWFQALFDRGVPEGMFTLALTLVFLTGIIANILMRKKRGI